MLSSVEILTTILNLADKHGLWPEIEQYGKRDRAWVENALKPPTDHLTTTQLHDLCFGAAIDEYALVNGEPVLPAPTPWQRNLDRHGVSYKITASAPTVVIAVKLELTPEEWCALCMRSGSYYRGSDTLRQRIVNDAFHDDGWLSSNGLGLIARQSKTFDGASSPCRDVSLLDRWSSRTDPLTPWERIGVLWQLSGEHLEGAL